MRSKKKSGEQALRGFRADACAPNNDELILNVLRSAEAPMTAYAILDAVRNKRITAPTTVYRALTRLIRQCAVHRLESINAYVACCDHRHPHGPTLFAICNDCGRVDELIAGEVVQHLKRDATRLGFKVEADTIELTGRCATCSQC